MGAIAIWAACVGAGAADAPFNTGTSPGYFADFEGGAGAEWSSGTTDNSVPGVFTRFSGRFGNSSQTLSLGGLTAGTSYTVVFDLYIIDSWDDGNTTTGDRFSVSVDGTQLFLNSFSQFDLASDTYPSPPDAQGQFGFSGWNDSIYRAIEVTFTAAGTSASITFQGAGLQNLDDESWGIDNVGVWTTASLPATTVVATSLPGEGTTAAVAIDRFSLTALRPLDVATATSAASYELRAAGTDGLFGGSDDTVYGLTPTYSAGTKTVNFATTPNPLQPGKYRFQTLSGLLDANSEAVTPFTREFTIEHPVLGRIENADNGVLEKATALPTTETPAGSKFYTAFALGTFQAVGDVDYWRIEAEAGDVLSIRLETASSGIYPRVFLRNASDANLTYVYGDSSLGQIQNATIPSPGTYYIRVWSDNGASPYRMRVDQSRGIQLESEGNDSQANANTLALSVTGIVYEGTVAGALVGTDSAGDYFRLGQLNVGNTINASLALPDGSSIAASDVTLAIEFLGNPTPVASATIGSVSHSVAADGVYLVHLTSTKLDLRGQYVLTVTVTDNVPPTITAVSLPAEGTTSSGVIDRFDVGFSEDMLAATVNAAANYELRAAGPDGAFDTADDVLYSVAPQAYASGLSASYLITDGPLQAGQYRFTAGIGLSDRAGNSLGTPYTRTFTIGALGDFVFENRDNGTTAGATALPLTEDPTGVFTGQGRGNLASTGDADYWSFSGQAGDVLSVAVEIPGSPGASQLFYDILKPDGSRLTYFYANSYNGWGQSTPVALPTDGTYYVAVNYYYQYWGEYRLRVTLARGGLQMESEDNNQIGQADVSTFSLVGGHQTATVAGYVGVGDPSGDYFALGNLTEGTTITLGLAKPASSPLSAVLEVYQADGTKVAEGAADATPVTHTVAAGANAAYYARVRAAANAGLLAQYVLSLDLADSQPPTITSVSLPAEGTSSSGVIDRFDVGFSEDMLASSVNAAANYDLRAAGPDGNFDTGDDVLYSVAPQSYSSGLSASYLISDGPLQAGQYRFTIGTGVQDRFGNALAADYVRLFTVAGVGDFVLENRDNGTTAGATALPLTEDPTGVFSGEGRGNLAGTTDVDYWGFAAQTGDLLSVAVEIPGSPGATQLFYDIRKPDGTRLTYFYANSYNGWGQNTPLAIPADGTYYVAVSYNYQYWGEYRLRVTLTRGGIQMESEANDQISQADVSTFSLAGGHQTATVHGYIGVGDPNGDYFALGNLAEGTAITLGLVKPATSPLSAILEVYKADGTLVQAGAADATPVTHTVAAGADAAYYGRVRAASGAGLLAQYVLSLDLADTQPPTITSVSLPAEGTSSSGVIDRFDVGFSKDMLASSVNAAANYDLRAAGPDGNFDTGDDVLYSVVPQSYASGLSASYLISDGPLQAGAYRFTIGTGLQDKSNNALAAEYVRSFTVAGVADFVLEDRDNGTTAGATALPLTEDPTGVFTGLGRGNLAGTGDVDYWSFSGQTGDLLTVAVEIPGSPPASQLFYDIRKPDGSRLTYFYANSYNGWGQNAPVALPADGTYYVAVSYYYQYWGEYRLRVTLARGGIQMESEDNNQIGQADVSTFSLVGGHQTAAVAGYIGVGDPSGDYFALGNLTEGTTITLGLAKPASSPLSAVLEVYQADGTKVAEGAADATPVTHTVAAGADAAYYGRVRAAANAGLLAQYVLSLDLADTQPPTITSVSLPAEGTSSSGVIDRFDVGFSKDMLAATVNAAANYELRAAGPDGAFDTADDVLYSVAPQAYASGLSASYLITDGPLQAGAYRFTISTGVQDRFGNALAADYVRLFSVEVPAGFFVEDQSNDTPGTATSLSPNPTTAFDGSFLSGPTAGVGSNPYGIAAGDLDEDGEPDVVTANWGSGNASVLLGNGDGSFQTAVNYSAGGNPVDIVLGDFNEDSHLDMAVANYNGANVTVRLGVGDGTFGDAVNLAVGSNPNGLAVADFNHDSHVDIATANRGSGTVSILLGNGDGTFAAASSYTSGSGAARLAAGKFNADNDLDLAVVNYNENTVSVLLGDGAGAFGSPTKSTTGSNPYSVQTADFDGNGTLDLAVANLSSQTVSLFSGVGDGTFQPKVDYPSGGAGPYDVLAVDLNSDTHPDLVVANYNGNRIGVLYNEGDGTFGDTIAYVASGNPIHTAVADFNQDGRPDIASANNGGNNVTVWLGNGTQDLQEDTVGHGIRVAAAQGNLSGQNDVDYWSFSAKAGDTMVLGVDVPGRPSASQLEYLVQSAGGQTLVDFYPAYTGWGQSSALTIPQDGTYVVRVSRYYNYFGEYQFRIVLAPPGVSPETEDNDGVASAKPLVLTPSGDGRDGTGVGYIRTNGDLDYYDLGLFESGETVFLNVRLLDNSPLTPVVSLYNSANGYMVEAPGGRPFDAVAEVRITTPGRYYAVVRGAANEGGLMDWYVAEVSVLPTASVAFPNLQVVSVTPPSGSNLKSGDPVTVSFTVKNVGGLATPTGNWTDRVVLSPNTVYGDLDDTQLGVFAHSGILDVNDSYTVTQTVNLPNGLDGTFHLIVQTDSGNAIPEFVLEADNTTVSDTTFDVTHADYPDLVVEGLAAGLQAGHFAANWNTANRGSGTAPAGFKDSVVVKNLASANVVSSTDRTVNSALAPDAVLAGSATAAVPGPGRYEVRVITDSADDVYEFDAVSHPSGEANNQSAVTVDVQTDLQVANLRVEPADPLYSGNAVTIRWDDHNVGNWPTTGSWVDRVQVVNQTTGQTLLNTTVAYDAGSLGDLAPDGSAARSRDFTLPDGAPGTGTLQFIVTCDANTQVVEYNTAGDAESNNSASVTRDVASAPYADLVVTGIVVPDFGDAGQPVTVQWVDHNGSPTAATGNWMDRLYLTSATDGSGGVLVATVTHASGTIDGNGDLARSATFNVPATEFGDRYLRIVADDTGTLPESNEANNASVSTKLHVRVPNLVVTGITVPATGEANHNVTFEWTVENHGDGATFATDWSDSISFSASSDGSGAQQLGLVHFTDTIAAGASVQRSSQVTLPAGPVGDLYIVAATDAQNQVPESNNNDNRSVGVTALNLQVVDLRVAAASAPASAIFGDSINVPFSVQNSGNATVVGEWTDAVYLSTDPAPDGSDVLLATRPAGSAAPLGPGSTADLSVSVPLPSGVGYTAGSYFLFVKTDANGVVGEANENNNYSDPIPISLGFPPLPDLVAESVTMPANAQPGATVTVNWSVRNAGAAAVSGTWRDSVYLSTDGSLGNDVALGTFNFTSALAAGASEPRSKTVTIPTTSASGNLRIIVVTDSAADVLESDEVNNVGISSATIQVPALLTLQPSSAELLEGQAQSVTVSRSGDRTSALAVSLTSSDTTEITVPSQIIIPAGQGSIQFSAQAFADGIVDGTQTAVVTAKATGFSDATAQFTVKDAQVPQLVVVPGAPFVNEGETLSAAVQIPLALGSDLTVTLSSSRTAQLTAPASVTIPAGQTSVSFLLAAVEDTLVEGDKSYTISAGALGHQPGAADVTVKDNDVPVVVLSVPDPTISENAGAQARIGTLTRSLVSDRAQQVLLQTDLAGLAVPTQVIIPANQASADFAIGVTDNGIVDGNRQVQISGTVLDSAGTFQVALVAPVAVTITDDDGPTLTLAVAKKLVAEGLDPATTATVTRNTDTTDPLTVDVASSDTSELLAPATVIIPAGMASATFNLISVNDGVTDGNQPVTVTADSAGFNQGVANLTVSDIDLPDLVVAKSEGPALAETEAYVPLTYRIENQGSQPAGPKWTTRVFLSSDSLPGDDTLVGNYTFSGTMPPGQYFEQSLSVRMPTAPGNYWVITQTDVADEITETLEDNNTFVSAQPIVVRPAYSAQVSTDVDVALAGTPIPMTGRALRLNGLPAPEGSLVNIHIHVRGTKRVISALVDNLGYFKTTWNPLPTEAGAYDIGAAHPGEADAPTQDSFVLLGMKVEPPQSVVNVVEEGTISGHLDLVNLSTEALTGLNLTVLEQPANLTLQAQLADTTLPGSGTIPLNYTITANDASVPQGTVHFRITSVEGAVTEAYIGVAVEALRPRLSATPGQIVASMLVGRSHTLQFTIANVGGRPTGPLNVVLPQVDWMGVTSDNPVPSLDPGASATIGLVLTPPANLTLGPYNGHLYVGNDTVGINVPFQIRATSDSKGDLRVVVVDEFTYYADGSPKVADANVNVRDPFTYDLVAHGTTGADGTFLAPGLTEGYYNIEVTAPKHTTYQNSFFVEPDTVNSLTTFISRESVTYSWKVEPVEIEDHYKITVETTFETAVPKPVITVDPPVIDLGTITAMETQVDLKIVNHGLIAAQDFKLHFPTHPLWEFTPLIEDVGVVPANSSLTIPVTIRKINRGLSLMDRRNGAKLADGGPCQTSATADWGLQCGEFSLSFSTTISLPNANSGCGGGPPIGIVDGWSYGGSGPGGGGCCGGGGPGGGGISGPSISLKIVCDPKCLVISGLGCIPGPIGCFFSGVGCGMGLAGGVTALSVADCGVGAVGCLVPGAGLPACIYAIARCFIQPGPMAMASEEYFLYKKLNRRGIALAASADPLEAFRPGIEAMLGAFSEITGAPNTVWLNGSAGPDTGEWFKRFQLAVSPTSDGERTITDAEQADLMGGIQPPGVPPAEVLRVIARWNRSLDYYSRGINTLADVPPGESTDFIDSESLRTKLVTAAEETQKAQAAGFNDPISAIVETVRTQNEEGGGGGVCARVKLRLEQEAVITRDAFRATLEIDNQDAADLINIEVKVFAVDSQGRDASAMFGIHPPTLSGLSAVDGTGTVSAGSTGSAKWLIVPTVDAAPDAPVQYFIAGEFSYDLGGTQVHIPLEPVSITVLPTPRLWIKYFHQRDVFSDDPFTDEIEPSIPYSLAVLVQNRGKGIAKDFHITSAQPQIVDNEKGLLIDFKIIGTEVAGHNITPSLTVNFGDILPDQSVVGRWLMTSTLQGLFTDYNATFEHVDGLGNPRLSLIEDLSIHEMIHLVQAGAPFEDGQPDFFVNEVPDPLDLGDTLYLSSGETNKVDRVDSAVVGGTLSPANLTVTLTAAMPPEWGYLRVPDPANGQYVLTAVERSDGTSIPVGVNVWTTDRTFVGLGKRPKRENLLHLLDYQSTGSYTLHYVVLPASDTEAPASTVKSLLASSPATFPVSWEGTDNTGGSGVSFFDVFVSTDGGPFQPWLSHTKLVGSMYTGQLNKTYGFYSRATDQAGNTEPPHSVPDALTTVAVVSSSPSLAEILPQTTDEDTPISVPFTVADPDTDVNSLTFKTDSANLTLVLASQVVVQPGSGADRTLLITPQPQLSGSSEITLTVSDGANSASRKFLLTVNPVNDPPVAGLDTLNRPTGRGVKVSLLDLIANDSDPEFDTISITGVSPTSAKGAAVSLKDGWVFYVPAADMNENDSFTYTLADNHGAQATGTVTVQVVADTSGQSLNILEPPIVQDGKVILRYLGIPNRNYAIQRATSLDTPNWETLDPAATADAFGRFEFTDTNPPAGSAFYRAVDLASP